MFYQYSQTWYKKKVEGGGGVEVNDSPKFFRMYVFVSNILEIQDYSNKLDGVHIEKIYKLLVLVFMGVVQCLKCVVLYPNH